MIDKATAAQIWEILVVECGANAADFEDFGFARYIGSTDPLAKEWRFQGWLGFGGKFWINRSSSPTLERRWYVSCYPEDETPQRLRMMAKANQRLATLQAQVETGTNS